MFPATNEFFFSGVFTLKIVQRAVLFLGTVITLLSGCGPPSQEAPKVLAVRVKRVVWEETPRPVELSGTVAARYESVLSFRVGGRIIRRAVDIGDIVDAGGLIAELDPKDYDLQVQNLTGEVASARSDYDTAVTDERRFFRLREQNVVSQSEYERQLNIANLAGGRLDALKARLEIARNSKKYTHLQSEYPGVVSDIFIEVGQVVSAGQAIARLTRTDELEIGVSLPENSLDRLVKARIEITLWGDNGTGYKGIIRQLSPDADPGTRTYLTKIHIDNPDSRLKLGRTARVRFTPEDSMPLFRLPMNAVWRKGSAAMVWVADKNRKTVSSRKVSMGPLYGNELSIITGVSEGELVVTAGAHKLSQGQIVNILD